MINSRNSIYTNILDLTEKDLTKYDMHDTQVHDIYNDLTNEMLKRLKDKGVELNG
ncbi:hypothetical protein [Limosilactobacillus fermentum]|uniref:hypothetical protein n=1 Tax=Limosilactobacillus fermentum TaxID=1613 RepID=UPI003160D9C7